MKVTQIEEVLAGLAKLDYYSPLPTFTVSTTSFESWLQIVDTASQPRSKNWRNSFEKKKIITRKPIRALLLLQQNILPPDTSVGKTAIKTFSRVLEVELICVPTIQNLDFKVVEILMY